MILWYEQYGSGGLALMEFGGEGTIDVGWAILKLAPRPILHGYCRLDGEFGSSRRNDFENVIRGRNDISNDYILEPKTPFSHKLYSLQSAMDLAT